MGKRIGDFVRCHKIITTAIVMAILIGLIVLFVLICAFYPEVMVAMMTTLMVIFSLVVIGFFIYMAIEDLVED